MSLTDVLKTPLRRLIPHEGLVIDVSTWDDAHQYHVANQRLHAMTMHNSGVVTGLEVVAWDPPDNSVVINPGIAVDSTGRTIVVGEPQRFQLQTDEAGTHYLVLQYREVPADSGDASENGDSQPHHVLEAYWLEERSEAPDESYVELARVQISGNNNVVSEPADPYNPGPDEIDVRDRNVSGPRTIGEINVGVIPLEIDSDGNVLHASGAMSLIRAINVTTGYLATFRGSINLNQEITDCDLLVMAGRQEFTLADDWALVLGKFMERGGVEAEATGESTPFQQSAIRCLPPITFSLRPRMGLTAPRWSLIAAG